MADQNTDSDEYTDIYCDLCKERDTNVPAQGFCSDCVEYLCSTCLTYHQRYLPTHKHQDENQMPKDVCTDTCDKHLNLPVKFYCENCNDFICKQCKIDRHKNCTKCSFLPLLAQNIEHSEDFIEFENRLTHFKTELDETKMSHDKTQENIEQYKREASTAMESQKQELLEEYGNATKRFLRTIEQTYNDDTAKYNSVTKELNYLADELKTLMNEISNLKNCEQRCKLFMKMKKTVSIIDHLDRKLTGAKDDSALTVTVYKYKPEISILKSLSVGEMDINGDIIISDDCERVSIQQKWLEIEQKTKEVEQMLEENKKQSHYLEQKSKEVEQKTAENEKRSKELEQNYIEIELKLQEIKLKSSEVEQMSREAEQKLQEIELKSREAEQKSTLADQILREAEQKSRHAEIKEREAESLSRKVNQNINVAEQKSVIDEDELSIANKMKMKKKANRKSVLNYKWDESEA